MDNQILNKAQKHVNDYMDAAYKEGKNIQGSPIGKQKRSQNEIDTMMMKLSKLTPEDRQQRLQEIANVSGHQGNQIDNCELCQWMAGKLKG